MLKLAKAIDPVIRMEIFAGGTGKLTGQSGFTTLIVLLPTLARTHLYIIWLGTKNALRETR